MTSTPDRVVTQEARFGAMMIATRAAKKFRRLIVKYSPLVPLSALECEYAPNA
jgi:regulator of extracellular matrix RemA (YlzA/DUF370 family)